MITLLPNTLEQFQERTRQEWVEQSGIDSELFRLNVECAPDEMVAHGGDVSRPLESALNWNSSSRWSLKGRERNYGAIIRSHDGSVFQVKLSKPREKDGKTFKYETPLGQSTKPFLATITLNIWLKVLDSHPSLNPENVSSYDTVVTFLYKYYSKSDYQRIAPKVTTDFSPAEISIAFWEWVKVNNVPIEWCEGAKKALCLLTHGYVAIALSGVSNGYRSPKDPFTGARIGKSYLVEDVAAFVTADRIHNITFDSDIKPQTVKGVNANIKSFGALINAKAKVLGGNGDKVRVLTWESHLGKGVDDLIVAHGIETFEAIVKQSKFLTYWKIDLDRQLTHPVSLAVCRQYLGKVNIPKWAKLIAIKSAMNTGKTFTLADAIAEKIGDPDQVIFVITHRDNLASELSRRFGIVHRKDIKSTGEGALFGYVLCADSLHGKADPNFSPDDYVGKTITVIIDECESVAWHVLSAMTDIKKHRPEVLENLSKLLAMALGGNGQVFLADAHLSDRSFNFFHQLACQSKPELIELEPFVIANSFKFDAKPWTVHPFSSKCPSGWKASLDSYLTSIPEAKVLIQAESQKVNSKWSTQTIEADLKAKFPAKRIVRVDSQTVQNPEHPAFGAVKNFTGFCKNWDIVICSNVIESGVSIDLYGHFDSVWACIWGVSSPRQANQMLARLRDPVDRFIWISPRAMNHVGNGSESEYALMKTTEKHTKATIQALQQNGLGDFETDDGCLSLALKTWASYGAEINHDGRNLCTSILASIAADGHKVKDIAEESHKDTDEEMEHVRDLNYDKYAQSVENQNLVDDDRAKELEKIKTKTDQQQQELRKYNLQKTYGESTADTVRKDDKLWYSQLNLHYLLTIGSAFLIPKDVAKTKEIERNGKGYAVDVLRSTQWRKVKLLEAINILDLIPKNGEKIELWNGCDRLKPLIPIIEKWRVEIKNVFGVTLKLEWFGKKSDLKELEDYDFETSHDRDADDSEPSDIKIVKPLLKLLGAKLLPIGKKGRRGEQVLCYEVVRDYESEIEDGKRVYSNIVTWGGDNRYQVFDFWLKRDTEAKEQNVSISDTVVTFLYKDNKKSDYEAETEKMTTVETVPVVAPVPQKPTPFKEGEKVIYHGFRYAIAAIKGTVVTLRDLFESCLPIQADIRLLSPV